MPAMQDVCVRIMTDRYALPGETQASHIYARVAHALAQAEPPARQALMAARFRRNMEMGAIGAGRIMANARTGSCATMVNCFVQPIGGSASFLTFEAGLAQACTTLAMGGGVGYDFTALPPAAATAHARATMPSVCQGIDRYDQACANLLFQGSRRGAQMAVLSCTHPDLLDVVRAKHGRTRWRTFNVSVAVSDAFLTAVQRDEMWSLVHPARPDEHRVAPGAAPLRDGLWLYDRVPARLLWDAIAKETLHSSEPGLLFIDTINRANNLHELESIRATNPCGEQPLPEYGSCVLGPINLTRLVQHPFGKTGTPRLNLADLEKMVRVQVRMLDNVIALTRWPLPAHEEEARSKRRIGIGVTGLADMLVMLQLRYDSAAGRAVAQRVARCIRDNAYSASALLAAERGPFPLYRADDYLNPGKVGESLPANVRQEIRAHGLRNSHLVSFAPTGTVSLAFADNCSNGIEPAYNWKYNRQVSLGGAPAVQVTVENHAWRLWKQRYGSHSPLPSCFLTAADIVPEDHVAMLAALQPYVDASISKTVPIPTDCGLDRVQTLFLMAWRAGLKGLTLFRPDQHLDAVMSPETMARASEAPQPACASCP